MACAATGGIDTPDVLEHLKKIDFEGTPFHRFDLANLYFALCTLNSEDKEAIHLALDRILTHSSFDKYPSDTLAYLLYASALGDVPKEEIASLWKLDERSLSQEGKSQLYQAALFYDNAEVAQRLKPRLIVEPPEPSFVQIRVFDALDKTYPKRKWEMEAKIDVFDIDILLDRETIIEIDGPSHFTLSGKETASTALKSTLLQKMGYTLIRIKIQDKSDEEILSEIKSKIKV